LCAEYICAYYVNIFPFSKCVRVKKGKTQAKQFDNVLFIIDGSGFVTAFAVGRSKSLSEADDILIDVARRSPLLHTIFTGKFKI
jgi:hypothetical protein